jgi:hypothetical protein
VGIDSWRLDLNELSVTRREFGIYNSAFEQIQEAFGVVDARESRSRND